VVPALASIPLITLALLWLATHGLRLALRKASIARPALPPVPLAPEPERRRARGRAGRSRRARVHPAPARVEAAAG
jgi:hypothetical protein